MNYTKGEWKAENFNRLEDGDWRLSCNNHSIMRLVGLLKHDENKANANLIAAAPDMYEVLKEVREFFVEYRRVTEDKAPWPILNKMGKALAKAEGRE